MRVDHETVDALCKNNAEVFLQQLKINEEKRIDNLSTCMCGWPAALTLLYITEGDNTLKYYPVSYQNSGDSLLHGEKSRVVGYQSIIVTRPTKTKEKLDLPDLNEKEKNILLRVARKSITEYFEHESNQNILPDDSLTHALRKKSGVFIGISIRNKLRGCMGRIYPDHSLYYTVKEMAVAAAYYDQRFEPVSVEELKDMKIEISILSSLRKINSIDEIEPGKHGILIKKGERSGTYLPSVATKTGWSVEELLARCSREKALIGSDGWKTADIYIYETLTIEEE